jgi:hypothetical protein
VTRACSIAHTRHINQRTRRRAWVVRNCCYSK